MDGNYLKGIFGNARGVLSLLIVPNGGILKTLLNFFIVAAVFACNIPASAQTTETEPQKEPARISLSGPRIGLTLITGADADELKEKTGAGPLMSQFGWQYEQQFLSTKNGLSGLSEWILLVGGVEQGTFIPSLSWLVGLRTSEGTEFGIGPNITVSGPALVIAAGITKQTESLNFPINLAVVLAKGGVRIGILVGFNGRD